MGNTVIRSDSAAIDLLLEKVYRDGGHDFREYKRSTIMRRLERRLHATGAKTCLDYMQFLDAHPEEYHRLADDLTIKVSSFFRSPCAFEQVAKLVLPELVSHKRNQRERRLRLWSTACAQGEEPYSIAILLAEFLGNEMPDFNISIHATDINQQALEEAKAGVFSPKDVEQIPPSVREKYFRPDDEQYVVRTDIKRMMHFSYFDLTAPAERLSPIWDCIFCCNVLIYFQKQLQGRVLNMLYDSLSTPGYLVLGEVETPTNDIREKLECLDTKARIYKKNGTNDHL